MGEGQDEGDEIDRRSPPLGSGAQAQRFGEIWSPSASSNPPHLDPLPSGRGDLPRYVTVIPNSSTQARFLLKYSYKSSKTAAPRSRRVGSSLCAMAIPATRRSMPG